MKKNYTTEEKQIVVQAYLNGKSATILSREYSVPRSTVYYWVKQHRQAIAEKEKSSVSLQDYRALQRKTEKSYRRKKRRYLSKSPFFSYFRGRIYFDRFTCDTLTKPIRTTSFFEIDPWFSVGG